MCILYSAYITVKAISIDIISKLILPNIKDTLEKINLNLISYNVYKHKCVSYIQHVSKEGLNISKTHPRK